MPWIQSGPQDPSGLLQGIAGNKKKKTRAPCITDASISWRIKMQWESALTVPCIRDYWTMTVWGIAWLCRRTAQLLIRGPRHGQVTEGAPTVSKTQPVQLPLPMFREKFPPTLAILPLPIGDCRQRLPPMYGNTSRIQLGTYGLA